MTPAWLSVPVQRADNVVVSDAPDGGVLLERDGRLFRLSAAGSAVWAGLDGSRGLRELVLIHSAEANVFAPDHVVALLERLRAAEMLRVPTVETTAPTGLDRLVLAIERPRVWRGAHRAVAHLARMGGDRLCHPGVAILCAVLGLVGAGLLWRAPAPVLSSGVLVALALLTALELAAHELAHGLVLHHFGERVRSVGVRWHWFGPMLFVDTTDAWRLSRRARIQVSLAGPLLNAGVGGVAAVLAHTTTGPLAALAWAVAGSNLVTALANLDPFFELDGYYVLVDALDQPGLRARAMGWLATREPATPGARAYAVLCVLHAAMVTPILLAAWYGGVADAFGPVLGDHAAWLGFTVATGVGVLVAGSVVLEVRAARDPALARARQAQRRS